MDVNIFYAITAATCFTLVGLWWSLVKDKPEWAFQQKPLDCPHLIWNRSYICSLPWFGKFIWPAATSDGRSFAVHSHLDCSYNHVGIHIHAF
jgi:hypothetical protein